MNFIKHHQEDMQVLQRLFTIFKQTFIEVVSKMT